jgi:ABC-type Zn uptake system ZnuABC Zn-binding protein ZnuA
MPTGVDPHSFEPVPRDVAALADADLVFINGLDVEIFIDELMANAGGDAQVLSVSEGIKPLVLGSQGNGAGPAEAREFDPHVWADPLNVVIWTQNIAMALIDADPTNADVYRSNAESFERELVGLDQWVQDQIALIPEAQRLLVTDHDAFGYFANRYGFTLAGTVIPGFSTLAEPSAQELAALEDSIAALEVKAIFVGNTVNPSLVNRVVQDTGTQLVYVYTGSLSDPGGPAASYPAYIRYNVTAIVEALTAGEAK